MFTCPGCKGVIGNGAYCSQCKETYCFQCANIHETNYRKLGPTRQAQLRCAACKQPDSPLPRAPAPEPGLAAAPAPEPAPAHSGALEQILRDLREGQQNINTQLAALPGLVTDVKGLKDTLEDLQKTLTDFGKDIEGLTGRVDDVERRITGLEKCPGGDLEKKVTQLHSDILQKEQWLRMNNIEIKGIPIKKNENLIDLLLLLGEKIGYPITKENINFVSRTKSRSPSNKPVVASFINRYAKENFVSAARVLKRLTAEDLGFAGNAEPVYVNDHLTYENKLLLTKTKAAAREKEYRYVWVKHCKIQVRKNDMSPIVVILCEEDLKHIK